MLYLDIFRYIFRGALAPLPPCVGSLDSGSPAVGKGWAGHGLRGKTAKKKNDDASSQLIFPHFVGIPEFYQLIFPHFCGHPRVWDTSKYEMIGDIIMIYPMNIPCFQDFPSIPLWLVKCPLIGCVDPHFRLNHQCLLALVPNKLMPKSWVISSLINEHALDLEVFEGADICVGQNWLLAV